MPCNNRDNCFKILELCNFLSHAGQFMKIFLVSACLVGLRTRYDGRIIGSTACRKAVEGGICIPVCPEQLGGLPTPRRAADLVGGDGHDVLAGRARVLNRTGEDVTENFILGARQVLAIARQQDIAQVILKARSPSCGLTPILGVTAALLHEEGYEIVEVE
jgi:uncharacterized protein YbbK (DUF523 family)